MEKQQSIIRLNSTIKMVTLVVVTLAVLSLTAANVAAITNGELFSILKGKAVEESVNPYAGDIISENEVDTIRLHGDADAEADMETLLRELNLPNLNGVKDQDVAGCHCRTDICACCEGRNYTIKIGSRYLRTQVLACVAVQYQPGPTKFLLSLVLNGHLVYHKTVSLLNPPKLCYTITYSIGSADVCLEIYNVNISEKKLCTRMKGVLSVLSMHIPVSFGIACFKIPVMADAWLTEARRTTDSLRPKAFELDDNGPFYFN